MHRSCVVFLLVVLICAASLRYCGARADSTTRIGVTCTECLGSWSLFTRSIYNGVLDEIRNQSATDRCTVEIILVNTSSTIDGLIAAISPLTHVVTSASLSPLVFHAVDVLPHVTITVMDPTPIPPSLINRTQVIALRDDQVGYLAGVVAGAQSDLGSVGYVGGPRGSAINNMRAGFVSGVSSVCPSCKVLVTNVNAFSKNQLNVSQVLSAVLARGPDIVWTAGGSGGSQILTELAIAGVNVIGVDADEFVTTLAAYEHNSSVAAALLTSSLKQAGTAVKVAIRGLVSDPNSFVLQNRIVGAQENVIELAPCHSSCGRWTARANESALAAQRRLKAGHQTTGINIDSGVITANRKTTSVSVSKPPISAAQQAPLRYGHVVVAVCWGFVIMFDGRWDTITMYDDTLMTTVPLLVVDAPPQAPVLGAGFTLSPVTINDTSREVLILVGGLQNNVASNKSYSLSTSCSSPGACTNYARWDPVIIVLEEAATLPPLLHHAASSRTGSSIFYVAGGRGNDGDVSHGRDIWRVVSTGSSTSSSIVCHWRLLSTKLPTAMSRFSFAVWMAQRDTAPEIEDPRDVFVAAGGDDRVFYWSTPFATGDVVSGHFSSSDWLDGSSMLRTLGGGTRQQPCIYREDPSVVVLIGVGPGGQSAFFRFGASPKFVLSGRSAIAASAAAVITEGRLSCAVLAKPLEPATLVAFAGWDSSLYHATFRQVFLISIAGATSTAGLVQYSIPLISCDASRQLVRSENLEQCSVCKHIDIDGYCQEEVPTAVKDEGPTAGVIVAIACGVLVAFVVGVLIGCCAMRGRPLRGRRSIPAPLQFPLTFVFVGVTNTSKVWQRDPKLASARVKTIRRLLTAAAAKHSCYEVRMLGDSCLLVASNPQNALHFALHVLALQCSQHGEIAARSSLLRRLWPDDSWPDAVPVRIVVNHGSRVEIRVSHNGAYDYYGPDIDETIAARWCVDGAFKEVAISGSAQDALASAGVDCTAIADFSLSETRVGSSSYKILRSSAGNRAPPRRSSASDHTGHATQLTSLEDVKVDLPEFTMDDGADVVAPTTSSVESNGRSGGHRAPPAQVPLDPMHVLNAVETQQLTQILSWALEAATAPLPVQQRSQFMKRLCQQNIFEYDAAPLPVRPVAKANDLTTSVSLSNSAEGSALYKVAASLLRQMDSLELRAVLTNLGTHAESAAADDRSESLPAGSVPGEYIKTAPDELDRKGNSHNEVREVQ